jgi:hypothetical protein
MSAPASQSRVRANQCPRSVNRAEAARPSVINVSIPSRARSAIVTPDVGLPSGSPCHAPFFLLSSLALKQANRAERLAVDKIATGARGSLGNRGDGSVEVSSFRPLDSSALFRRMVMAGPPLHRGTLGRKTERWEWRKCTIHRKETSSTHMKGKALFHRGALIVGNSMDPLDRQAGGRCVLRPSYGDHFKCYVAKQGPR